MQESILSESSFSNFTSNSVCNEKIAEKRSNAFKSFIEQGLPTPRDEDWKYTNLSVLEKSAFKLQDSKAKPTKNQIEAYLLEKLCSTHLVFVDGKFSAELSNVVEQKGLKIKNIAEILSSKESDKTFEEYLAKSVGSNKPLFSLNTAYISDGAFIHVEKNADISCPIHLVFLNTGTVPQQSIKSRVLILAEEGSKSEIIESYIGLNDAEYFTSNVTEVFVEKDAQSHHYRIIREAASAVHISNIEVQQEDNSRFLTHAFNFDGKLIRNDVSALINGEEVFTGLYGLNVADQDQHIDNNTVLDHAKPNCESDEQYRGIYAGQSKGIFSGTIIVRQDAQKTNAIQSNQSVLLSDDAESNSRPQLKIWADDVRCTHGATVGQLDEEALFYLRSRGIPKNEARNILVHAFASDVVNQIEHDVLREYLEELLTKKLDGVSAG